MASKLPAARRRQQALSIVRGAMAAPVAWREQFPMNEDVWSRATGRQSPIVREVCFWILAILQLRVANCVCFCWRILTFIAQNARLRLRLRLCRVSRSHRVRIQGAPVRRWLLRRLLGVLRAAEGHVPGVNRRQRKQRGVRRCGGAQAAEWNEKGREGGHYLPFYRARGGCLPPLPLWRSWRAWRRTSFWKAWQQRLGVLLACYRGTIAKGTLRK